MGAVECVVSKLRKPSVFRGCPASVAPMSDVRMGSVWCVLVGLSVEGGPNFIAGSVWSFSPSSEFVWFRVGFDSLNPVVCHQLYCPKLDNLLSGYYRHCLSALARSSGPANPVKVSVRILRKVIVDDVRDSVNV